MITLGIILFLAVLGWDLWYDYRKWIEQRKVDHTREGWLRAVLLIPSIVFMIIPAGWWGIPVVLLMWAFVYWTLFDGLYNKLRGFKWWFTGSDDPDDAKTDNFLQRLTLAQHIILKLAGCALFLTLYIILVC